MPHQESDIGQSPTHPSAGQIKQVYSELWNMSSFWLFLLIISIPPSAIASLWPLFHQGFVKNKDLKIQPLATILPMVGVLASSLTIIFIIPTNPDIYAIDLYVIVYALFCNFGWQYAKIHNSFNDLNSSPQRFNPYLATLFSIYYINYKIRSNAGIADKKGKPLNLLLEVWIWPGIILLILADYYVSWFILTT